MIPSLLLFLVSFASYLHGASPVLDGGDSGEFIASSFSLGVPHAPGYPLYQLLGKAFQTAVPLAAPSYRMHVLSALLSATLLVILFHFLCTLLKPERRWAAFGATLFLAFRPLFVEQARVVEVFSLNAIFLVGIFTMLLKTAQAAPDDARWHLLAAFLFGVGMGNHHTLLVVAPLFLPLFARPDAKRIYAFQAIFFVLGLSLYAYLPIRAADGPPVNFGDPETWSRFWNVITRREFGTFSLHPAAMAFRDGKLVMEQTAQFFGRMIRNTGVAGTMLALLGAVLAIRRAERRWIGAVFLLGWLGLGWGFEIYSNLSPFSDIGQWRLERFYLVPLVASVGLMALALENGSRKINGVLVALLVAESGWAAAHLQSSRNNLIFNDLSTCLLRSAPRDSRLVIDRVLFDEPTSGLLVASVADHKRSDIEYFYRPGTLFRSVYGEDFLELSPGARGERQWQVESQALVGSAPVRMLAFEKANAPFASPRLEGFLYASTSTPRNLTPFLVRRDPGSSDYPSRLIGAHFGYFLGKAALEAGDADLARHWFASAARTAGRMAWLQSNIGGVYAQTDFLFDARRAFDAAVSADPYFYEGQYGLGYAAIKAGDWKLAVRSFEAALRLAPNRGEGHYMLGVAYYESNDLVKAAAAWERYLVLEPRGKMAAVVEEELKRIR